MVSIHPHSTVNAFLFFLPFKGIKETIESSEVFLIFSTQIKVEGSRIYYTHIYLLNLAKLIQLDKFLGEKSNFIFFR